MAAPPLEIKNQQKSVKIPLKTLQRVLQTLLKNNAVKVKSLTFVLVTDRAMKALNRRFLQRDHTTDVLAFDYRDEPTDEMEGEVVVSAFTAVRQAKEFGTSPLFEILLYCIHGVLHLMGYDDHSPKDKRLMRQKEKDWMVQAEKIIHPDKGSGSWRF